MGFERTLKWLAAISLITVVTTANAMGSSMRFDRYRALDILDSVSRVITKHYYDPTELRKMHWKALKAQEQHKIDRADNNGQMLAIISSFVDRLDDSHTFFIPPSYVDSVKFGFEAEPVGKRILVYKVKKNSPAQRAGLKPGDRIIAVNGFRAVRPTFDNMMLYFKILRPVTRMGLLVDYGSAPPQKITVNAKVIRKSKLNNLTNPNSDYILTQIETSHKAVAIYKPLKDDIAYVRWRMFADNPRPLEETLKRARKARAIILDLRRNPGGAVDTLETMAGYFVQKRVDMAMVEGRKKSRPIKVTPSHPYFNQPLFILVDSESSSAAEIFARYFQETHRATIIGDQTSGRVAEAQIFPETQGLDVVVIFGVEVDVGHILFSNGEDLEHRGVTPNRLCLPAPADLRAHRDPALNLAIRLAKKAIKLPQHQKPA